MSHLHWHCKLDEASSLLTTFSTPFGQFKWNRLPFGICVSSAIFQRSISDALEGLIGVHCNVDDIIVAGCGTTHEEAVKDHNENLRNLLQRCAKKNIGLNKGKIELCRPEIAFHGHMITANGLGPDPAKVKAVLEMEAPKDIKGVQRVCGFVNYLAKFLPSLSDIMQPLRQLTRKDVNFHWGSAQQAAFSHIKKLVTSAPVLTYYSVDKDLAIQCDLSEKGLGAALLQRG